MLSLNKFKNMIKNEKISDLKRHNLTGVKVGKLTVLNISEKRNKHNRIMWDCICECGNKKTVAADMLNKSLRGGIGTKSCGCLRNNSHNKIKDRVYAVWLQLYNSSTLKKETYRLKKGWSKSDIAFETFKALCSTKCFYCGAIGSNKAMDIKEGKLISDTTIRYNGLDRVDSSIGYMEENIIPCCKYCNRAKSDTTDTEFLAWIKRVYKYNFK
jgi:hypothetical protein